MEDDRIAVIEAQLAQAKQIADEADRKYEEVKYQQRRPIPANCTDSNKAAQTHFLFRRLSKTFEPVCDWIRECSRKIERLRNDFFPRTKIDVSRLLNLIWFVIDPF